MIKIGVGYLKAFEDIFLKMESSKFIECLAKVNCTQFDVHLGDKNIKLDVFINKVVSQANKIDINENFVR